MTEYISITEGKKCRVLTDSFMAEYHKTYTHDHFSEKCKIYPRMCTSTRMQKHKHIFLLQGDIRWSISAIHMYVEEVLMIG